ARIEQAAEHAVKSDRSEVQAWTALGHAHVFRCIYEITRSGSSANSCERAKTAFASALAIESGDPQANNGLGNAHRWAAVSLYQTGHDPTAEYEDALRSYGVASKIAPHNLYACVNRLDLHASLVEYQAEVGVDPQAHLSKAREVGAECSRIDRKYYLVYEHLARSELGRARYLESRGDLDGVQDALERASRYLDEDEAATPGTMAAKYWRLVAVVMRARSRLRGREDPTRLIAQGRALMTDPALTNTPIALVESARLGLIAAQWAAANEGSAQSLRARALRDAETATGHAHWLADAQLVAAEACYAIATAQRSRELAKRGVDHVDNALRLDPQFAAAKQLRGKLEQLAR
ncbi:MAG TPA: hypothetical protein VLM79_41005, partial [Kofleriaceae bacterium]|nr:hypothetical protein [Kofleriaceae bacterium]